MNTEQAGHLFESLSSLIRLAIFQVLSAMGTQGMVVGDLAKQLNLAPNHLSFHSQNLKPHRLDYQPAKMVTSPLLCQFNFNDGFDPFSHAKLLPS